MRIEEKDVRIKTLTEGKDQDNLGVRKQALVGFVTYLLIDVTSRSQNKTQERKRTDMHLNLLHLEIYPNQLRCTYICT